MAGCDGPRILSPAPSITYQLSYSTLAEACQLLGRPCNTDVLLMPGVGISRAVRAASGLPLDHPALHALADGGSNCKRFSATLCGRGPDSWWRGQCMVVLTVSMWIRSCCAAGVVGGLARVPAAATATSSAAFLMARLCSQAVTSLRCQCSIWPITTVMHLSGVSKTAGTKAICLIQLWPAIWAVPRASAIRGL